MTDLFRFIGEDGSMGYSNGSVYLLKIKGQVSPVIKSPMLVSREVAWQIPYDSWNSFLENWERV